MKNNKLTFEDFQLETISRKEQKTIKGGEGEPLPDPNPGKGDGGNGST
ncbi:rSAM-modified peptide [Flavobacterium sp. GN10]|uniref:RSAM-modified peptide n=1 Tax=Flavobacterium tagetis TaxID=2801336 RepID=A0ABS1K959_9FLAO|nr:rSAM-modified peptide [Flavobacterium tagetis]MBL0735978.1 rSAM-modified peptide [Flavobacterium tagetis]